MDAALSVDHTTSGTDRSAASIRGDRKMGPFDVGDHDGAIVGATDGTIEGAEVGDVPTATLKQKSRHARTVVAVLERFIIAVRELYTMGLLLNDSSRRLY